MRGYAIANAISRFDGAMPSHPQKRKKMEEDGYGGSMYGMLSKKF